MKKNNLFLILYYVFIFTIFSCKSSINKEKLEVLAVNSILKDSIDLHIINNSSILVLPNVSCIKTIFTTDIDDIFNLTLIGYKKVPFLEENKLNNSIDTLFRYCNTFDTLYWNKTLTKTTIVTYIITGNEFKYLKEPYKIGSPWYVIKEAFKIKNDIDLNGKLVIKDDVEYEICEFQFNDGILRKIKGIINSD